MKPHECSNLSGRLRKAGEWAIRAVRETTLARISYEPVNDTLVLNGNHYSLMGVPIAVLGWGKAADPIVGKIVELLPSNRLVWSVCVTLYDTKLAQVEILTADHPLATARNRAITDEIVSRLKALTPNTMLIAVSTGGGSAMLIRPAEGLSWENKLDIVQRLVTSPLDIRRMNRIRCCLSSVKGGRLLDGIDLQQVITIVVSDDVLSAGKEKVAAQHVASGPTIPSTPLFREAIRDLKISGIWNEIGPEAKKWLLDRVISPPKRIKLLCKAHHVETVADNSDLVKALSNFLYNDGFIVECCESPFFGEVTSVASELFHRFSNGARQAKVRPYALVAGGEAHCRPIPSGIGGRCQHMVCLWIPLLASQPMSLSMAFGSDGRDYLAEIAGALATSETFKKCQSLGINVNEAVNSFESYKVHAQTGGLIKYGRTDTNVGDAVVLAYVPE